MRSATADLEPNRLAWRICASCRSFASRNGVVQLRALAVGLAAAIAIPQVNIAQVANDPRSAEFGFRVAADEVGLTFHAAGANGQPIGDLKADELKLLDNGQPPQRILAFYSMQDRPIRAGILIDTSESMQKHVARDRAIALRYAQKFLRAQTDQAFVMDFGYLSKIEQSWTADPASLSNAAGSVQAGQQNPLGGTALFDTVFRACFHEFGKVDRGASGNFILLFSDGEDNASHTSLQETVDICQRTNTAVYAFRAEPQLGPSTGPATLAELTRQTGGRVFHDDDSDEQIDKDLSAIETDLRSQYRLVYKPAELKHDGSFHHIAVIGPDRVESIHVRSGYYAPKQ